MASAYRRQDNFSPVDHLVLVSGAQNITACENQGKQRELSDHWNLKKIKNVFFKKTVDNAKNTKKLTEIQVLTKKFMKVNESLRKRK